MSKPLLKWAGGKSQLISTIEKYLPEQMKEGSLNNYVEPFFGGGAVFFRLASQYKFKKSYLSDKNIELIILYNVIQQKVSKLIKQLSIYQDEYFSLPKEKQSEMYYRIRRTFNDNLGKHDDIKVNNGAVIRAAQLVFMNRTCFNGLFRVNQKGLFNVPIGRYKNPRILDEENLLAAAELLKNATIRHASYQEIPKSFLKKSFIYFDPPYRPLNKSSSFTAYSKFDFNDESQIELAKYFKDLATQKDACLMLSNSDPKNTDTNDTFFDSLYDGFNIRRVKASRMINSKGGKRGKINELLITNY
jgi:DNA adenine methylase